MSGFLRRANVVIDKSCSALVSCVVIGVNVYCVSFTADTVAVPVFTAACCVTAAVSKVLKRVINQSRPSGAPKLSPGMPSNHATTLSFLSIAACAGLAQWSTGASAPGPAASTLSPAALLACQASLVLYGAYATALRVGCGHHTWPQVLVGYALGTASVLALLGVNYAGYGGERAGGRVDELPQAVKMALLGGSVVTCTLAFRAILRGSPLFNKSNVHG